MGAAFTERVTDGISNRHSDKYYFPLLKVAALLFSTFIRKPVLWGDAILMSEEHVESTSMRLVHRESSCYVEVK